MQTSESIAALASALSEFQGEVKSPPRSKEVEVTPRKRSDGFQPRPYKFKYAPLDIILETVRPVMSKHGLAIIQTVSTDDDRVRVTTRIVHTSGEWVEESLAAKTEGLGFQALGSGITYLKRYSLAILGVADGDDTDANDADGNDFVAAKPKAKPIKPKEPVTSDVTPTASDGPVDPINSVLTPKQIATWTARSPDFLKRESYAIGTTDDRLKLPLFLLTAKLCDKHEQLDKLWVDNEAEKWPEPDMTIALEACGARQAELAKK